MYIYNTGHRACIRTAADVTTLQQSTLFPIPNLRFSESFLCYVNTHTTECISYFCRLFLGTGTPIFLYIHRLDVIKEKKNVVKIASINNPKLTSTYPNNYPLTYKAKKKNQLCSILSLKTQNFSYGNPCTFFQTDSTQQT